MKKTALAVVLMSAAWAVSAQNQTTGAQEDVLKGDVVEITDPDHIAAVEARARELEARQGEMNYEAPAAGKHRKHVRKHKAKAKAADGAASAAQ